MQVRADSIQLPVELPDGTTTQVAGDFRVPEGAAVLQVLVPGATYTKEYWSWPERSYIDAANAAGYATLAVDRLGVGESASVDPNIVTLEAETAAILSIVEQLGFPDTVLVGHGIGSAIAVQSVLDRPSLVTTLVVTGFTPYLTSEFLKRVGDGQFFIETFLDSVNTRIEKDDGWFTIPNAARAEFHHDPRTADSYLSYMDNVLKNAVPVGLRGLFDTVPMPVATEQVAAPVFIALGQYDRVFGSAAQTQYETGTELVREAREFFAASPRVNGYLLPDAGHALCLASNADQLYAEVMRWLESITPARRS